ncbi:MAG: hypothetical protein ACI89L_000912 [Phycisphaerales bacterium]|jgi:hypothetical protein
MPEFRLIYISTAVDMFTAEDLERLTEGSAARNSATGLTGMLLYAGGIFLQALEGDREVVEAIYAKIAQDPRHTWLKVLQSSEITERMFVGWSMTLCNFEEESAALRTELEAAVRFLDICEGIDVDLKSKNIIRFFRNKSEAARPAA